MQCPVCVAAGANHAFKGQDLAVVGGGDTAAEEALYLTKYGKPVRPFPMLRRQLKLEC